MLELGISGLDGPSIIGTGGFSTVYRARETEHDRWVAVKVLRSLDEASLRRFDRERRAMGRLSDHSSIVTILRSGTTVRGEPYLVMPLVQSGSLAQLIADSGPLAEDAARELMVEVARAVHYAHDHGVIHQDLKPGNILVADDGRPLVTDFGIAQLVDNQTATVTAYTPAFTAPEIFSGEQPSTLTDVYGLGATLYCAVVGSPPIKTRPGEPIYSLITRAVEELPEDPRSAGVSEAISVVLRSALAKSPEERPQSADEFAELLLSTMDSRLGSVPSDDVGTTRLTPPRPLPVSPLPSESAPTIDVDVTRVRSDGPRLEEAPLVSTTEPVSDDAQAMVTRTKSSGGGPNRRAAMLTAAAIGAVALIVGTLIVVTRDANEQLEPSDAVGPSSPVDEPSTEVADAGDATVAVIEDESGIDQESTDGEDVVTDALGDEGLSEDEGGPAAESTTPILVEPIAATQLAMFDVERPEIDETLSTFESIDGLAFDAERNVVVAVKEPAPEALELTANRQTAAVFSMDWPRETAIDWSSPTITADSVLRRLDGVEMGQEVDVEGAAQFFDGSLLVVSEGVAELSTGNRPTLYRFDSDGILIGQLGFPDWMRLSDDDNLGLSADSGPHGVAHRSDSIEEVVVIVESPLKQDRIPEGEDPTARMVAIGVDSGLVTLHWSYPLAELLDDGGDGSRVVDMTDLGDGSIIVLERFLGSSDDISALYRIRVSEENGVLAGPDRPPTIDKIEVGLDANLSQVGWSSLTAGPTDDEGRVTLILATNSNYRDVPTTIAVVALESG